MRVKKSTVWSIVAFIVIFVVIPLLILNYQAKRKGLSLGELLERMFSKTEESKDVEEAPAAVGETIHFLDKAAIGDPGGDKPWITHLIIDDLDRDGLKDVIVCDAKLNEIRWLRQTSSGVFSEQKLGDTVRAPAQVASCDIDKDGDSDLLVACMGMIFPNNDKIGSVVVLENNGQQQFTNRELVQNIARVTDVQPGDFDGDGDIDLAVGQFGYDDGEIRWMENQGNWNFKSRILLSLSGTINTPVADIDGDGDADIVALVSQEWEETYVFENDGSANFKPHMVYGSTNEDFGSSNITLTDMDRDGDLDVLYTNGDAFDYIPPSPRPWHGVQWLENKGGMTFTYHRIGNFNGAFSGRAADMDNDGDLDVLAVSCFNNWKSPNAQSLVWFENDGKMAFTRRNIAANPTHLLVLQTADMDNDGKVDLVTGGMHAYPPFDRISRVLLWKNNWNKTQPSKE
jgi:hypothetical protein